MATTVKWNVFEDADIDTMRLYRAITGLEIPFPNSLSTGNVFKFIATDSSLQTLTVGATDIDSILALLNTAKGVVATKDSGDTKIFLRIPARIDPRLVLFSSSALTSLGETPRTIVPRSEFKAIHDEPFVTGTFEYEFEDLDGDPNDWYYITTIKSGAESFPSIAQQPHLTPEKVCVIEGRVTDLQNNPIVGVEVEASVIIPPNTTAKNTGIVTMIKQVLTDEKGRWSITLIRGQLIMFHIEAIGYNQIIEVPDKPFELFRDLEPLKDHEFAPNGEPLPRGSNT